jgi:glutamate racemase
MSTLQHPTAPIGIFDSGVGGLTVYKAIKRLLPQENIIYLGDTARIPYGTRSPATVRRYAQQDATFLANQGVKLLIVACNTISSVALPTLQAQFPLPIWGVIEPGARQAALTTRTGRIGIIATEATIESNAYYNAIQAINPNLTVISQACPLFVALAEEGWQHHPATVLIAQEYLAPLQAAQIDTLVLGCTHYPILRPIIQKIMGPNVTLIDSGECVAMEVSQQLKIEFNAGAAALITADSPDQFFVTDSGRRFRRIAELFLGAPIENLSAVDIWNTPETLAANSQ